MGLSVLCFTAAVSNISVAIVNSTSVVVSWIPPPALPGWNISYYYLTYRALNPREGSRVETTFTRSVDGSQTSKVVSADELLVEEEMVHVFEVAAALKIEDLEGIGEVKGEAAAVNASITTGMAVVVVVVVAVAVVAVSSSSSR